MHVDCKLFEEECYGKAILGTLPYTLVAKCMFY